MNCCKSRTIVINSRTVDRPGIGNKGLWKAVAACGMTNIIWRVRRCVVCKKKIETIELESKTVTDLVKRDSTIRGRNEF